MKGGSNSTVAREILRPRPLWGKPRPFRSFLRETINPTSPIDLFLNEFSAKACKVSHNSSFLSSVDREGGSI